MYYTPLDSKIIVLGARDCEDFDVSDKEAILIPQDGSRVFVHWLEEEKVLSTYTMHSPTKITGYVRLTNGTSQMITIKVIFLD